MTAAPLPRSSTVPGPKSFGCSIAETSRQCTKEPFLLQLVVQPPGLRHTPRRSECQGRETTGASNSRCLGACPPEELILPDVSKTSCPAIQRKRPRPVTMDSLIHLSDPRPLPSLPERHRAASAGHCGMVCHKRSSRHGVRGSGALGRALADMGLFFGVLISMPYRLLLWSPDFAINE